MERNENNVQEYIKEINEMYSKYLLRAADRVNRMLKRDLADGFLTESEYKELSVYNESRRIF